MSKELTEEARISEYARAVDASLLIHQEDARWEAWVDEAAVGRNAHEAGRDKAWPVLHFDDVSAIPFLQDISGVEFYQLRARLRATDGDLFAATCPAVIGYEAYNQAYLGLGSPSFVYAESVASASEIALACQHGSAFELLKDTAARSLGMTVHPYMGAEPAWKLTKAIAEASGQPVRCVGPRPAVCAYANHKGHVSRAAEALLDDGILGGAALVDSLYGRDPESLTKALRELAARHARVALKMTRCASAMGNGLFESSELIAESFSDTQARVSAFLKAKEWMRGDEVIAMAWEDAWSSPSTQLWLPDPKEGGPLVEGVYEQLLVGPEQVFLGALPSRLGATWDERLSLASLRIARLYQHLGYRGRCSFDFIIAGESAFLVECNGRWGGTSTPMHLVERVASREGTRYRARDVVSEALVGVAFNEVVEALSGELYDRRSGQGTYMLYNVGCLAEHGKLDVVAVGRDDAEIADALDERLPKLLGL